jgi:formylglycine-generating enzyme required for sulfatase activity
MTQPSFIRPFFSFVLATNLLLGPLFVPMAVPELLPSAEASSKDKRTIKKLKKQTRGLRKTVNNLKRDLTATRAQLPKPSIIEMVKVPKGDLAENPTDAGNTSGASVYGRVPYDFSIGKYEVSLAQYTRFLNAVAASDTYSLYNPSMATDLNIAGIERSGDDGSYTYAVIGSGARPVTYVSWFDAARFCNWLHNECPTGGQDETTTESGAYTLDGATSGGLDITRNPGAKYWIPSEDEWYKAAFHDPRLAADGGPPGDDFYWLYPTMSDTPPGNDPTSPFANHANHFDGSDFSVTQSGSFDSNQNYLTDGGSYEGSAGPYGTFDQGGNVWEWNDAAISGSFRGLRGGSWNDIELTLRSSNRVNDIPDDGDFDIGFRVASP